MPQISANSPTSKILRWLAAGTAIGVSAYAAYVATTWRRYGKRPLIPGLIKPDPLLDQFMPNYEVSERNAIYVPAPAAFTLLAAIQQDFTSSKTARALFKARETILGAPSTKKELPSGLLSQAIALGWGILAEVPGREIVFGAVTRPWEANVVFRPIPPSQFATFNEPGYVKIIWTLRADSISPTSSVARTETRVSTTDAEARRKFRLYWSFLSPGIILIRHAILLGIRRSAQRMMRAG